MFNNPKPPKQPKATHSLSLDVMVERIFLSATLGELMLTALLADY